MYTQRDILFLDLHLFTEEKMQNFCQFRAGNRQPLVGKVQRRHIAKHFLVMNLQGLVNVTTVVKEQVRLECVFPGLGNCLPGRTYV